MRTLITVLAISIVLTGCVGITDLPLSPLEQEYDRAVAACINGQTTTHFRMDKNGNIEVVGTTVKYRTATFSPIEPVIPEVMYPGNETGSTPVVQIPMNNHGLDFTCGK